MAEDQTASPGNDSDGDASGEAGLAATIAAFLANLGIAIAKFVAFFATGAASLLAEGVHSVADTGNQGLLLWGRRRAKREPTSEHPFGFGRERYFWSFVVALVLFSGGSLFALVEGEEKLRTPHELTSYPGAAGVLLVSMVFESLSLRTAVRESRGEQRRDESWLAFVRRSKTPEIAVVLLEDTGALIGLLFAFVGVTAAELTGESRFDALGSIAIGLLLGVIAITLAIEMKSRLIGEAAPKDQHDAICDTLRSQPDIVGIADLRTEQIGPGRILVVASVNVDDRADVNAVLADAESAVRARVPDAKLVYLEPVAATGTRNW
jgi:cation diffusion facilitator family transporter